MDYRLCVSVSATWSYDLSNVERIVQLMLDFEPRHDRIFGQHIESAER